MTVGVRATGTDDLARIVRRVADKDLKDQLKATNKTAAQIVVAAALPNVPVLTGRLRGSVRALASQRSGRAVAGRAVVPYAAAVHWGRKRGNVGSPPGNHPGTNAKAGQPFLWDAAQAREAQVADQYERDVDAVMDAVRRLTSQ